MALSGRHAGILSTEEITDPRHAKPPSVGSQRLLDGLGEGGVMLAHGCRAP